MEFYHHETLRSQYRDYSDEEFEHRIAVLQQDTDSGAIVAEQFIAERHWVQAGRPFYNVWPRVIAPLTQIKLHGLQPCRVPKLPTGYLVLRFSKTEPYVGTGGATIQTALLVEREPLSFFFLNYLTNKGRHATGSGALMFDRHAEIDLEEDLHRRWVQSIDQEASDSIAMAGWNFQDNLGFFHLLFGLHLLCSDPDSPYLTPIVLAKDRTKWEETKDQALVDRAKRRGNFGWDVGREIHVNPHWRKPHAALYHTGKGRLIPKVIFRKGALVKRETVQKMPTGYLDHEEPNAND